MVRPTLLQPPVRLIPIFWQQETYTGSYGGILSKPALQPYSNVKGMKFLLNPLAASQNSIACAISSMDINGALIEYIVGFAPPYSSWSIPEAVNPGGIIFGQVGGTSLTPIYGFKIWFGTPEDGPFTITLPQPSFLF